MPMRLVDKVLDELLKQGADRLFSLAEAALQRPLTPDEQRQLISEIHAARREAKS